MVISILRQECNKVDCRIAKICAPEGLRRIGRPHGENGGIKAGARWDTYVQKCMQWRKWLFELNTKSGPWRPAISAKIARGLVISRMWQIFKLDAKSGPFKLGNKRRPYN